MNLAHDPILSGIAGIMNHAFIAVFLHRGDKFNNPELYTSSPEAKLGTEKFFIL